MGKSVIGLGAGGHAKVIIEILRTNKTYEIIGLLDPNSALHGKNILGVPVLGNDHLLIELKNDGINNFFVGLGSIGDNRPRQQLFDWASNHGMKPINVIHPSAIISPSVKYGKGVIINAGAIINANAQLGLNVIINTGAIIEHDCVIGDHVHIATGAQLASTVNIGLGTHIGIGASVRQSVRIGKRAIVGGGAVVVKDVASYSVVVGVPAEMTKKVNRES